MNHTVFEEKSSWYFKAMKKGKHRMHYTECKRYRFEASLGYQLLPRQLSQESNVPCCSDNSTTSSHQHSNFLKPEQTEPPRKKKKAECIAEGHMEVKPRIEVMSAAFPISHDPSQHNLFEVVQPAIANGFHVPEPLTFFF